MIRGTREWAVAEINCCVGCPHGCRYCYARTAALKTKKISSAEMWAECRIIREEVEKKQPLYSGRVMFPAGHDIIEENLEAAITVIANLLEQGNQVLIVSKPTPRCIERICRQFAAWRKYILFRFTITARNQEILSFWEPGAPGYQARYEALGLAVDNGYETSVSIEPMLDVGDVVSMVGELESRVTHSIWIGTLNRADERVLIDSSAAAEELARVEREQCDTNIWNIYRTLQENPLVRWKESIKQVVGLPLAEQPGLDQ